MSTLTLIEKACTRCGETKPLSQFHRNRNSPDGHASACKPCRIAGVKAAQDKRRAEMGEEAYLAMVAANQRARRRLNDDAEAYDRDYMRARHQATAALIDRHRDEFEHLLLLARRGELT